MTSPKLIAYKAIAEMTAMMSEFMRNPEAIAQYGKEAAAAAALTDAEIEKRLEAERIIEDAKAQSETLKKNKAEFDEQIKKTIESFTKQKDQLDSLKTQCDEQKSTADKVLEDALKLKKAADDLTVQANNKLFDIESREKAYQKNLEEFDKKQKAFDAKELQHKENVKALDAREKKIREAVS